MSVLVARGALAQPPATEVFRGSDADAVAGAIPDLGGAPALGDLVGRPIDRVEVVVTGPRWVAPAQVRSVHPGEPLTLAAARRAARELLATGAYAKASTEVERTGGRVILRVRVLPRRLVANVRVDGGALDDDEMLREAHIAAGAEVTAVSLPEMESRARGFYAAHGFPSARITIEPRDTDDRMRVALHLQVEPGAPRTIARRVIVEDGPRFAPDPKLDEELHDLERSYRFGDGDRLDEEALASADHALVERLKGAGYHRAKVAHQIVSAGGFTYLYVRLDTGPKLVTRYEGLEHFDADQLDDALDLEKEPDRGISHLAAKIRDDYVKHGFLDVEVTPEERGGPTDRVHVLFFRVREGEQVRVGHREFPCLGDGPLSAADARRDIESFLEEELPGGGLAAMDPAETDAVLGPGGNRGSRPRPLRLDPDATFAPDTYDRAMKHVQDYLRSEGYLSATVGPLELVRRTCDPRSPPGRCLPLPLPVQPKSACTYDPLGIPTDEPPADPRLTCQPDVARGVTCEPRLSVRIPIKLGPRTLLWDLAFDGNKDPALFEKKLAEAADLTLGSPVSQLAVEAARRRVLDAFKEQGYAFAEVRAMLDFSPDRTRARLRFVVSQGERVVVDEIRVRGAHKTDEALILRRTTFEKCPRDRPIAMCVPFRPSDVRKSEERIATLGTFSSVAVTLEDPYVPAKRKVVIIDVQERLPQYLDIKPGFSTGEGFRIAFEYGHRNVAGEAIQLTFRVQLGYLPDPFILDPQVRANLDQLSVGQRLERRDTVSLAFPEVGLGPLVRFNVDYVDVRDNFRDFGLSKEALVGTFTYRPVRQLYAQLGSSLEYNDVGIFNGTLTDVLNANPGNVDLARLLRAPEGSTVAVAQRIGFAWDRRDNPFGATKGTLLSGTVEHVYAFPESVTDSGNENAIKTDFFRLFGTASGYVRLTDSGMAIAASLRGGRIVQSGLVPDSKTYPDRLFFLGGVDSLRGFLQDSLVPQDVADQIQAGKVTIDQIALRGGDVYINPRLEWRIPLSTLFETAVFLDAGNLWVDPKSFDPFVLRYATGTGLRIATPIGPVAFDYGINLNRRSWEDFGAFHFSIGLF